MVEFISVLDLFTIGIGPSSSHTVGPMRAARTFVEDLDDRGLLSELTGVRCALLGSLGSTGIGHGTPQAVIAGLQGMEPESCDPAEVREAWRLDRAWRKTVLLNGKHAVQMVADDVRLHPFTRHPEHPNAMTLTAMAGGVVLAEATYLSLGGGFVRQAGELPGPVEHGAIPYPFHSAAQLLELCDAHGLDIADVVAANEIAVHGEARLIEGLDAIWDAMDSSIDSGLSARGTLPGPLRVPRRAGAARQKLEERGIGSDTEQDWLHAFAMAVNEENASGERVVTAPTNGAAGILPAVIRGYLRNTPDAGREEIRRILLTACAIGSLIKMNASISGAEAGCQGEVGSACAMAAAGLTAVLGGTARQIENAAEIAIEHHLGLTCDPVGGLVQIPCIERNAVASTTAMTAMRIALMGDGQHVVSLDTVIETMRQTGADMSHKYKETSEAGLAVNVIEC